MTKRFCIDCAFSYIRTEDLGEDCILKHRYGSSEECLDYFFRRPVFCGGLKDYERNFLEAKAKDWGIENEME